MLSVWLSSWEGYRMICSWVLRDVQRQPASSGYKSKELAGHLVLISISVRLRCVYNAYLMPPFDTDGNRAHDEILSARSLWSTVCLVVGKEFPRMSQGKNAFLALEAPGRGGKTNTLMWYNDFSIVFLIAKSQMGWIFIKEMNLQLQDRRAQASSLPDCVI